MFKAKLFLVMGFVTTAVIVFAACTAEAPGPVPIPEIERENLAIIIDRTGREWDVTHARDVYGMNPDYFNYGLGIGAIPSVDDPTVLEEGDPGYPDQSYSGVRG